MIFVHFEIFVIHCFECFRSKFEKICHCCWINSMFCQFVFSSIIFAINLKINSIFFVFRNVKFDVIIILFRRWKKNDDEIIWNRQFNRSKKCERKITKKIIEIVSFEIEMNVVNWSLIQSRKNWLFRYVSVTITKFQCFCENEFYWQFTQSNI